MRHPIPLRTTLVLVAAAAVFLGPARTGHATFDKAKRRETLRGVVFLLAANYDGSRVVPFATGSGTILTPEGAILTNHHVIWNDKKKRMNDVVFVGLLKSFDQEPQLTCAAFPKNAVHHAGRDLALIRCEQDMQGRPYSASGWPTVKLGSSEDLVPGDEVWVIGYPGIGGATIHVTAGKVSGFVSERGGAGRDWIKTDAAISHGNSGGTAVDEDGNFIGVPSARLLDKEESGESAGSLGLIRPVELARDLVELATSGWAPGEPGGRVTPAVPDRAAGVTVIGRVRDAANDEPVARAVVLVFKRGVRLRDVTPDTLADHFLTKGVTNRRGEFVTEKPVPRGGRYTVAVVAEGYDVLGADGILSTEGEVPARFEPWGVLRLDRR